MFNNKVLLIAGGTGSFGNAVLRRFLSTKYLAELNLADKIKSYFRDRTIFVAGGAIGSNLVISLSNLVGENNKMTNDILLKINKEGSFKC